MTRLLLTLCFGLLIAIAETVPSPAKDGFLPFFDTVQEGADDPAPPPPSLGPMDKAMLEVCGAWGSTPTAARFRAVLDRSDLAEAVRAMAERTMPNADLDHFKTTLTHAWFDQGGFRHVFCGEPGRRTVGGLHYAGRYLQLQDLGVAGRLPAGACSGTEIAPPIYTFGIVYVLPGEAARRRACPKGYAYDLHAQDLLTAGLQALLAERHGGMCLARVSIGDGATYEAVFVARRGAIRTFYPDASPRCSTGGARRDCRCGG